MTVKYSNLDLESLVWVATVHGDPDASVALFSRYVAFVDDID